MILIVLLTYKLFNYQTKYNEADAFRVASRRAASTNKRHRIRDDGGSLIDTIE